MDIHVQSNRAMGKGYQVRQFLRQYNEETRSENNTPDDFDGFVVEMFLDEDGDYLAHFAELPNVSAFGQTPAEALVELKAAWELMKECYREDGEPIPKANAIQA